MSEGSDDGRIKYLSLVRHLRPLQEEERRAKGEVKIGGAVTHFKDGERRFTTKKMVDTLRCDEIFNSPPSRMSTPMLRERDYQVRASGTPRSRSM